MAKTHAIMKGERVGKFEWSKTYCGFIGMQDTFTDNEFNTANGERFEVEKKPTCKRCLKGVERDQV